MEDLTFPVVSRYAVNLYVNAFGEHIIPTGIVSEALRLNGAEKSIFDKRTLGYRVIARWAKQKDADSEKEWLSGGTNAPAA